MKIKNTMHFNWQLMILTVAMMLVTLQSYAKWLV